MKEGGFVDLATQALLRTAGVVLEMLAQAMGVTPQMALVILAGLAFAYGVIFGKGGGGGKAKSDHGKKDHGHGAHPKPAAKPATKKADHGHGGGHHH